MKTPTREKVSSKRPKNRGMPQKLTSMITSKMDFLMTSKSDHLPLATKKKQESAIKLLSI